MFASLLLLVVARALQGVFGALLVPAALSARVPAGQVVGRRATAR
ncbi:hypothetical protein [Streptomyces sp. SudanB52_2052]